MPDVTFVATAIAIRYVGAEPVFVDAAREDPNLDVGQVHRELKAVATPAAASGGDRCRPVRPLP